MENKKIAGKFILPPKSIKTAKCDWYSQTEGSLNSLLTLEDPCTEC